MGTQYYAPYAVVKVRNGQGQLADLSNHGANIEATVAAFYESRGLEPKPGDAIEYKIVQGGGWHRWTPLKATIGGRQECPALDRVLKPFEDAFHARDKVEVPLGSRRMRRDWGSPL